jgi:hypothetical protein
MTVRLQHNRAVTTDRLEAQFFTMPKLQVVVFLIRILLPSDSRCLSSAHQLSCGSENMMMRRTFARQFPWATGDNDVQSNYPVIVIFLKASKRFANIAEAWRVRAGD